MFRRVFISPPHPASNTPSCDYDSILRCTLHHVSSLLNKSPIILFYCCVHFIFYLSSKSYLCRDSQTLHITAPPQSSNTRVALEATSQTPPIFLSLPYLALPNLTVPYPFPEKKKMNVACQCGNITFTTPLPQPLAVYICHCDECRRQSSSAFGCSAIFPKFSLPNAGLLSCYSYVPSPLLPGL
jgi:hypothetical protein